MQNYLQVDELKDGYVYKIEARNANIGVWFASEKAFIISRWKFKSNYLFLEFHWDTHESLGTVKPVEVIERFPFEVKDYELHDRDNSEVLKYLDNLNDTRDKNEIRLSYQEIVEERARRKKIFLADRKLSR